MILLNNTISQSFYKAFDVVGKRWTGLIIGALVSGPLHFTDLREAIPGIAEPMLSKRLKELTSEGMVLKRVYNEIPVRIEYELTSKGYALKPVLQQVYVWAEEWG